MHTEAVREPYQPHGSRHAILYPLHRFLEVGKQHTYIHAQVSGCSLASIYRSKDQHDDRPFVLVLSPSPLALCAQTARRRLLRLGTFTRVRPN